uniref:Uncharacterized protein LOC113793972 n=1 Tax=Dermatophagoides pteronyssinus TaxID=6956 RepID=A0A6P6Y497_DERPT|nr:uncharacterized protein LOC113793972 [Dermatophagoides pteronyssinus]
MDSSQDSIILPPINEPKCEELFDQLFTKNHDQNDPNDDEHLNVKKPIRTYENVKSKIVRFCDDDNYHEDNSDNYSEDDQESLDENHVPLFNELDDKPKKTKKVRKKKLAYPNVSKDAVLEAFQKAIESKELPDFDEIDKFPLEIRIVEQQQEKKRQRKSERQQPIKTRKSIKNQKKPVLSKVDQNQENVNNKIDKIPVRRSNRSSRKSNILMEQNPNKTKSSSTNEEQSCTNDLFVLDESYISCISSSSSHGKSDQNSEKLTNIDDLTFRKASAIKSSTPFRSIRSRTLRKRLASKHNFTPN